MYTKEMLEKLIDIMPDYVFYRDINGKNIYCNESYAKFFIGKSKEDIYGKTYEELDMPQNLIFKGRLKDIELIRTKKSVVYEIIVDNDGCKKVLEVNKYPLFDKNQNIDGILGVIKDVSYKYEMDNLRDGFFSNINHEFRTPLNMILSTVQLLESKCAKCEAKGCNMCFGNKLENIHKNSLRLLKLSNNFIDLTNFKTGNISFDMKNHDIVSFVERICDSINGYKKFNGISIIFDTEIEELIVSFDTSKLERAILNIVSNAIKFNKVDGQIYIKIDSNEDYVKIHIQDSGVGIKEEELKDIFNLFFNMENRMTKICEGSGVGLALTKQIIENHDGYIEVNSKLDVGSEFILNIPNIYDKNSEIDSSYEKVYSSGLQRIKMELSDIYEY